MTSDDAQSPPRAAQAAGGAMQDQACAWIARLRADTVSAADHQAFALWLAANPAHSAAMDAMLELWGDLGVLQHYDDSANTAGNYGTGATQAAEIRPHSSRRRWLATGAALAASLCLAVLLQPQLGLDREPLRYQTGLGEQLSAVLEDGSSIRLNTNSSLEITFSDSYRQLVLHRGEAYFEVAHQPQRPFVVSAGNLEVQALGTAFNVYLQGETGTVTVTEGVVRVTERNAPGSRPAQTELLYKDQQLAEGRSGLRSIQQVDTGHQLAWRDGRLVAEEMPLLVLVEQLSRYHPNRIFIAEPRLADRTVSGVFMIEDLDSILLALEHTAQVRSVTLEDGSVQLIGAPL